MTTAAQLYQSNNSALAVSPVLYLKKQNSKLILPDNLRPDGLGLYYACESMGSVITGQINDIDYKQFNAIMGVDGTGGGAFIRVSSLPTNASEYEVAESTPNQKGSVRFYVLTSTFEGHNGSSWQPLH